MDAVLMIFPPPCVIMWGAAAFEQRNTPLRSTASKRSQS